MIKKVVDDRIGLAIDAIDADDGELIEITLADIDKANIDF